MAVADRPKDVKKEVDKVSTRVSALRDDLLTFQNEYSNFKEGVVRDLKNIVEYLGKQKNK
jgi:hypothetical protein